MGVVAERCAEFGQRCHPGGAIRCFTRGLAAALAEPAGNLLVEPVLAVLFGEGEKNGGVWRCECFDREGFEQGGGVFAISEFPGEPEGGGEQNALIEAASGVGPEP